MLALAAAGVCGIRLNLVRPLEPVDAQLALARRVAELAGWHAELHVDSRRLDALDLDGLYYSIDHLGRSNDGLPKLLRAVERGARVKASGFGRGDVDVVKALRAIDAVDPTALMFGTDLPSTRDPVRPFQDSDVDLVRDAVGERALYDNAAAFYLTASLDA